MTEPATIPPRTRSAFHGLLHPGRHGAPGGEAGLVVQERVNLAALSIAAFRGRAGAVRDAVRSAVAVPLPAEPRRVEGADVVALWAGPERWMLIASGAKAADLERRLAADLHGLAAVAAIGDGRVVLRLSGPRVVNILARGVAIDLDSAVFPPGFTALTPASMIDVQLSRLPGDSVFELILPASMAGSLWHWLEETGAEHGIDVLPPA